MTDGLVDGLTFKIQLQSAFDTKIFVKCQICYILYLIRRNFVDLKHAQLFYFIQLFFVNFYFFPRYLLKIYRSMELYYRYVILCDGLLIVCSQQTGGRRPSSSSASSSAAGELRYKFSICLKHSYMYIFISISNKYFMS